MAFNLFSGDPQSQAMLALASGMLESGGPSRTPVSLGQGAARGMMQGREAFMAAQQAQQKQKLFDLQMQQVEQAKAAEAQRAAAIAQLSQDPRFSGLQSLLQVDPKAAIGQAYPEAKVVAPGGSLVAPNRPDSPLFTAPPKPAEASPLAKLIAERDAIPQGDPRRTIYDTAITKATEKSGPLANVDVKVNTKTGESLAGQVGNIATEGRAAAVGAIGIVDTVGRVGKALESGNITLGPGATIRNKVDQVSEILGVGGASTAERLVNTRNAIRGLAQFTVGARKALKGQGQVSDYEGKLLTRAESGEIDDFTAPELRDFLKVTERLARLTHAEHKRIIGVMSNSKDESVRGLVDYFDIPDLPAAEQAKGTKIKKYNPATGRIE